MENNDKNAMRMKLRVLCLHGSRTSGLILKKQLSKWDKSVLDRLDMVFVDGPIPTKEKSLVEGFYEPPYYKWFEYDEETMTKYRYLDEAIVFVEECLLKHGPFHGILGFSQGAILGAGLVGFQQKGLALTNVPRIQFLISISGGRFKEPNLKEAAFSRVIDCPSIHILGAKDPYRDLGEQMLESFKDSIAIWHSKGHIVPKLDKEGIKTMHSFLNSLEERIFRVKITTDGANTGYQEGGTSHTHSRL
eukprot:Gb_17551 [translate_table: standard]